MDCFTVNNVDRFIVSNIYKSLIFEAFTWQRYMIGDLAVVMKCIIHIQASQVLREIQYIIA